MSLFFPQKQGSVAKIDCLSVNVDCSGRGSRNILIPMSAVAEIILNQEVTADNKSPAWMFGWVNWRNLHIPLIDFAGLQANRQAKDFADNTRILVLNSLLEGHKQRYYAIISKGFPSTLRIEEDSVLVAQDDVALAPCISINIEVEGQFIQLPDFQQIEDHLREIPTKL
jgi:chemosensory pili system protein ChpC